MIDYLKRIFPTLLGGLIMFIIVCPLLLLLRTSHERGVTVIEKSTRESFVDCKLVVGNNSTITKVWFCKNSITDTCFYMNQDGRIAETACYKAALAER